MRDFRTVLIADAVSGVYDRGIQELDSIGVATPSLEEYLGWLAQSDPERVVSRATESGSP
jgi:hypothetical protein